MSIKNKFFRNCYRSQYSTHVFLNKNERVRIWQAKRPIFRQLMKTDWFREQSQRLMARNAV